MSRPSSPSTTSNPTQHSPPDTPNHSTFPEPLIIPPLSTHKTTFIFLHGLGSTPSAFSHTLLSPATTSGASLPSLLPHTKFIFPAAPIRRITALRRSRVRAWFDAAAADNSSFSNSTTNKQRRGVQWQRTQDRFSAPGLRESVLELASLVRREIALLSNSKDEGETARDICKVVLSGISQGCATSLAALLCAHGVETGQPPAEAGFEMSALAGFVGFCGYLPFAEEVRDSLDEVRSGPPDGFEFSHTDGEEQDGAFTVTSGSESDAGGCAGSGLQGQPEAPVLKAAACMRELLAFPPLSARQIEELEPLPVLLVHGSADTRVPVSRARAVATTLRAAGFDVTFCEQEGVGHEIAVPEGLDELVEFLRRLGWDIEEGG